MTVNRPLTVIEVDPSLFTAPYDAALSDGLEASGIRVVWATRPLRYGEINEFRSGRIERFFYRFVDRNRAVSERIRKPVKGISHIFGLIRLLSYVWRLGTDIVHFQWAVVPVIDAFAIRLIKRWVPVVITVHDTTPFNGDVFSPLQASGLDAVIRIADHAIVHTASAKATLLKRGHDPGRISIIPHGPLNIVSGSLPTTNHRDSRWTFVLFGQIKPYKGLALLVEALAALTSDDRTKIRVIVAGEPMMDLSEVLQRISEAELTPVFDFRLHRLSDQEAAELLSTADSFVFPYSQIDASGVYYLVKGTGKWIVATQVGIFSEDIVDGESGRLVPPGDAAGLAAALREAANERRTARVSAVGSDWNAIGQVTRTLFESLVAVRRQRGEA